jgi:hypothetical protein
VYLETKICSSKFFDPLLSSHLVPENLYMCCISFISGKAENMSSRRPSTQYYERRKKSHRDVNVGEGSSKDVPLRKSTRVVADRNLPRGHMHIDTKIEEDNKHIISSSEDDEKCRISPRAAREAVLNDDEDENMEDVEDEPIRQDEEEEQEGAEGFANPQQRGRIPFPRKQSIRRPHKPLNYSVVSYQGKGTTKEVKILWKIDPRSQQKGALDYRFHTHFHQHLYEIVIMLRRRIV